MDFQILVTKDMVESAVKKDFGESAILKSFEVKGFAEAGGNYVSRVSSVSCEIDLSGESLLKSYIIKINPKYEGGLCPPMINRSFKREAELLSKVCPLLTEILEEQRKPALRLPVCVFAKDDLDNQIMMTKDLREKKFKPFNRKSLMDVPHCTLIMQEMARFHSTAYIHKKEIEESGSTLLNKYPYLIDEFQQLVKGREENFHKLLRVDDYVKLMKAVGGYEKAIAWLEENRPTMMNVWVDMVENVAEEFQTICHGDCWSTNFLFRYDDDGMPIEAALLDLQISRISSPATDLQFFLLTSTDGTMRKESLDLLLRIYYETYESVITGHGKYPMAFTFEELKCEFIKRFFFGAMTGMYFLRFNLMDGEEIQTLEEHFTGETSDAFIDKEIELAAAGKPSTPFRSRFLAMFDDLIRFNLI